ncbi:MAG TPA: bifunctional YncE family protein/alkaline phosphatase family protein [Candidatus Acidoferrales bacterium]|nr:bifunctional YncE family protein/alkaline phosphatase family protein [Candidatus Acidoferrales bacterium]
MNRRLCALALCLTLLGASTPARPTLIFDAPAGTRPAGPLTPASPFAQILPSGRIINPIGSSAVVGMNALGVALTPDGRYAIVSNDDERQATTVSTFDGETHGGYSLAVVDTRTMTVVDRYQNPQERFFVGVVALADPADPAATLVLASGGASNDIYVFDIDANGQLTPDPHPVIAAATATDPAFADDGHAFPGSIAVSRDGAHAYVVNELAGSVSTIDMASRELAGVSPSVGFFPYGIAIAGGRVLVTNEGLMRYAKLPASADAPPLRNVTPDLAHASSLSAVPIASDGTLAYGVTNVPMDPAPDGLLHVGGAHPCAIVTSPNQAYAYVAMANVDRIATVALRPEPHVIGGAELRLYGRGPYGTQPNALALSRDGKRLYVALAGLNAVAIIDTTDPRHLRRVGLLPTGWYPSALALSSDDRFLFVANAKGFGEDPGFTGDIPVVRGGDRVLQVAADSNAIWSTLQRIDLSAVNLRLTTRATLSYQHVTRPLVSNWIVPQMFSTKGSTKIKHVVFILEEDKTYDSMLGDLTDAAGNPYGPGDPALVAYDASVTPNLHALARTYGLAGNFYADAEESDAGHQFAAAGTASVYTEKTLSVKGGRQPLADENEDPEDYPRAGYIFDSLALAGKSYRDYGDFVRVSGYDEGASADPLTDDPNFAGDGDTAAPTAGLGGTYRLDVPALGALRGHLDREYPGWNLRIRDVRRAAEFIRDFDPLVRSGHMPAFTYIWLPDDHGGSGANIPPLPEEVADGDRALGQIVDYLTHLPEWHHTAIFVTPDDAQSTRDHVSEHRTYAIVISPYVKHHYVSMQHLSTTSVLKTEEELLGLPALSLGDTLATDMRDLFTSKPDFTPYVHTDAPPQQASAQASRILALLARTDQSGPGADTVATGALAELAREADVLAKRRAVMDAAAYTAAQQALYEQALAVVR